MHVWRPGQCERGLVLDGAVGCTVALEVCVCVCVCVCACVCACVCVCVCERGLFFFFFFFFYYYFYNTCHTQGALVSEW